AERSHPRGRRDPDAGVAALVGPRGTGAADGRRKDRWDARRDGAAAQRVGSAGVVNALELIVGVLLAGAAVWFVLRPVLRPEDAATFLGTGGGAGPENEGDDPDDDFSPRAVALRALR